MTAAASEVRDRVGPYTLIQAIGAGGSARIDLARIDRAYGFQRHVVLKRPLEHLRGDPAVAASLQREARLGGKLRHPNLVAVLDAGEHDGYDYLVLEYIHGASLRTVMQTETGGKVRVVPLPVALGIAIDVARGLHEAHELRGDDGEPLGLVHRDVSPGNVLLGLDGAVKVADFGIAKETRVATLSGSMHGTVTYMAPEQCRGQDFDRRADVWAIGVILYELLTHERLFWADNDVASLHRVLSGQVVRPRRLEPTISPALEEIVMTAVAHDPDNRFASAKLLADSVEALSAREGHVLGARMLARVVETVIGAKQAPWAKVAARSNAANDETAEQSLVAVIESLASEEAVGETFGPIDDRASEEGEVPSVVAPAPVREDRARNSRGLAIALAVGAVAVAAAVMWLASGGRAAGGQAAGGQAAEGQASGLRPQASGPDQNPAPVPAAVPAAVAVPVPVPNRTMPGRRHPHQRSASPPPSPSPSPPPSPPPSPSLSPPPSPPPTPAAPPNVEWKPTMLLPTDNGSAK